MRCTESADPNTRLQPKNQPEEHEALECSAPLLGEDGKTGQMGPGCLPFA